jgi:hypothetical protein
MCAHSQILSYSATEDDLPMTMQVAMIAANGIVLASDLKWVTLVGEGDRRGPLRHSEYKSKIKTGKEIAICCAGDMIHSSRLADEILLHWREGEGDEAQRIHRIVEPLVEKQHIECLVAVATPNRKLIYVLHTEVRSGAETEWQLFIAPVRRFQTAGDQANAAKFWLRYYDASLSVEELKGLAAHLVIEAANFNNEMIGGLEVVVSDDSGFVPLSEAECENLEAEAIKGAIDIGGLIFRPPKHK